MPGPGPTRTSDATAWMQDEDFARAMSLANREISFEHCHSTNYADTSDGIAGQIRLAGVEATLAELRAIATGAGQAIPGWYPGSPGQGFGEALAMGETAAMLLRAWVAQVAPDKISASVAQPAWARWW